VKASPALASIIFVLHSHLPYIKVPDTKDSVEETWLYEAIIESYVPLIFSFERLINKGVSFKLVLSLSPTLLEMLNDEYLQKGLNRYLERLEGLAGLEEKRSHQFGEAVQFYRKRLKEIRDFLQKRNLTGAFKELKERGNINLITTTATHAYLPLFSEYPWVLEEQIRGGIEVFKKYIDENISGLWLPECGYFRGLFEYLKKFHIDWTVLEGHGIAFGTPKPETGIFRPIRSPEGVLVFPRDSETCKQVWSREVGYPGNVWYRDFYKDVCYELNDSDWKRFRPDGIRHHTGLKYWRITGRERKEPYLRQRAIQQVEIDARHFVDFLKKRAIMANRITDDPVIVLAFDTELFGHWWFEGPEWLEKVFELISETNELRLALPEEIIFSSLTFKEIDPLPSSWGEGGFNNTWVSRENSSYLRLIYRATELVDSLLKKYNQSTAKITSEEKMTLIRELLLLQSSDFLFMLKRSSSSSSYAEKRLREHLNRLRFYLFR
jgi:1,4-alpha-glucan branching enzyme